MSRFGLVVIAFAAYSRAESAPSPPPPPADAPPPPAPLKDKCRNPRTLEQGSVGFGVGNNDGISECTTGHPAMALPKSVSLAIAPNPVILRSGQEGSANLVIENGSAADVELYLDDEHDALTRPTYEIDDAAGKRVDALYGDVGCAELGAVIPQSIHIGLSAHRFTTVPFDVRAIVSRYNSCKPTESPLRAGRYVLVVHTPLGDVRGKLTVR
jgi:hypothetical protein